MRVLVVVFLLITSSVVADPGSGRTREERKKARIEKQMQRMQNPKDQRSREQKRRDRNVLIFMAISAGLVVKAMSGE
jgi:hypothetical protein